MFAKGFLLTLYRYSINAVSYNQMKLIESLVGSSQKIRLHIIIQAHIHKYTQRDLQNRVLIKTTILQTSHENWTISCKMWT